MKVKLVADFDEVRKKGFEVEIDKIVYDPSYAGNFKVRVSYGFPKSTKYLSITWIVKRPEDK